jgi:hypothetical protein
MLNWLKLLNYNDNVSYYLIEVDTNFKKGRYLIECT